MPDLDTTALFRPFSIKGLDLKNRIVMAPMTRTFTDDGAPTAANAAYYRRRAEGGVGLIISEGTAVDRPAARNHPGIPLFHSDAALAGWKLVIDAVHAAGGKMGPQLWHVGSMPDAHSEWAPPAAAESPSGLVKANAPRGIAMDENAIADTIAAFARATADASRLGFDTVELHAAHGYLIDQFFWEDSNQRTDRFGGVTLKERSILAGEVIRAVRAAIRVDLPLILRVSQWKLQDYGARLAENPAAMEDWLLPLVESGVDILHCSQRRFWEPEFPEVDGETGLNFAGWAKKLTGAATISVGSVGLSGDVVGAFGGETSSATSLDQLIARMERDEFDLIAVGRALISNPDWAQKVEQRNLEELVGFDASALGTLV